MTTTMHFEKKKLKKKNFEHATRAKREKQPQCAYISNKKDMFLERLEDVYVYNACIYKAGVYSAREEFLFYENG